MNAKLRGHYGYYGGYYGRIGNRARLWTFRHMVIREWKRWPARRSQQRMSWDRVYRLMARYSLLTAVRRA